MEIKRLYEAEDIDLNTGEVEDNTKNRDILVNLITNRVTELKTLGEALIFAVVGLDDDNTISTLKDFVKGSSEQINNFKPLAQALDNDINKLQLLSDNNHLASDKINDSILAKNEELLKEIYALKASLEKPLLDNIENVDIETFTNEKNSLITKLEQEYKHADYVSKLLYESTSNATEEGNTDGPSKGQSWLSYLLRAKKNGNEEQAWNYYYEKVWGSKATIIQGLGKAFRIEVYNYGTKPYGIVEKTEGNFNVGDNKQHFAGNPFISFLNNLNTNKELPETIFMNLKPDHYNFIHNAVVNEKLNAKDLTADNTFSFGNIIYNKSFYDNFEGKDLTDLLYLQHKLIVFSGVDKEKAKVCFDIMYKNYQDSFNEIDCCFLELYPPTEIGVRIQEKLGIDAKEKAKVSNKVINGIFRDISKGEYAQFLSYIYGLLSATDTSVANKVLNEVTPNVKNALSTGTIIPLDKIQKFANILNDYSWNADTYRELILQINNKIKNTASSTK